jgi:UDP-N-acetyl-D-mannosaminuronic acid transferase (WecB/TagA/CpsF family)
MRTVNILGVPIATVNMNEAIARIEEWAGNGTKTFVTTRQPRNQGVAVRLGGEANT